MSLGVVVVAHVPEMATGFAKLLQNVAPTVAITAAGGNSVGSVGTSMDQIERAFKENQATELLVFYDFGSARRNIELAAAFGDKNIYIYDAAFTEGAYTAATLLQAGQDRAAINADIQRLIIK
ncbi:PTS sugar transporter subunit IIA domain-containing protein [Loigolactobacillus zhaoyuanensis]|uniref:PTS sugar transporter subunit IIA domain-containing protein n=1 Tax=Loigolactobacillus zhaoyuanensis TaxID=2486017 RepID=UPI000F73A446|nr:PTS-dependent dihydroxyacetone kinase phosphotransferase subunit DhaM [Loigolactobacillus zhaoyuanensis]